jgi:hypothetical protein
MRRTSKRDADLSANCSLTSNWKRKSSGDAACRRKRLAIPPCAPSAIPL